MDTTHGQAPMRITAEVTPNPHTLKFNLDRVLLPAGSMSFTDRGQARGSRLAEALFGVDNVIGLLVGRDFLTVTKAPAADWQPMVEPVTSAIREVFSTDGPLFAAAGTEAPASAPAGEPTEIERRIMEVLDNEIRPAVNMDGGDVIFHGFKDGVVTLYLQGSCSSCPSAIMTLKMGIENRLRSLIPEVREVVQV